MTASPQGLARTPPAQPSPLRRARPRLPESPFTLWIIGLIVLGLAARVAFYTSRFGRFDSDEAVGGLMARDALHGHLTTFYWGQGYGGPLETWLAAPLVGLFGSGWLELRLIPIACCAVASLATWRVGLRTIGRAGAMTAAALFWFFPMTLLWRTTNFYVIYAGSTMLGIVTVLQVLRMWERPTRRGMFILGLVAGVGIWQSFQLVTIVPTAIVWLLIRRREAIKQLPVMLVGAALGLVPVLASNVRHGWWSARTGHSATELHYLGRLGQFFTNSLPVALDLRVPLTLDWFLWKPVAFILYGLVIVALLWLGWTSQAQRERRGSEVLVAILVVFPFIYAISPLTTFKLHSGYVVVLAPVLMLGLCAWIRTEAQAILTSVVAIALLAHSFVGLGVFLGRPGPRLSDLVLRRPGPAPARLRPPARSARRAEDPPCLRQLLGRAPDHLRERWARRGGRHPSGGAPNDHGRLRHPAAGRHIEPQPSSRLRPRRRQGSRAGFRPRQELRPLVDGLRLIRAGALPDGGGRPVHDLPRRVREPGHRSFEGARADDQDGLSGLPVESQSTRPIQRSRFSAYQRIVCRTPSSHETCGSQPVSRVSLSWPTRSAITSLAPGR